MTLRERVTNAVREEILRQYREDERGQRWPGGPAFYEQYVSPYLIAGVAMVALGVNETGTNDRDSNLNTDTTPNEATQHAAK